MLCLHARNLVCRSIIPHKYCHNGQGCKNVCDILRFAMLKELHVTLNMVQGATVV